MPQEIKKLTIKDHFTRLIQNMQNGILLYCTPLLLCIAITLCTIVMELFCGDSAGIEALFSDAPLFQSLWVTLAFSFACATAAMRLQKRLWKILLHSSVLPLFVLWFAVAKYRQAAYLPHYDLFHTLLILLFYAAALCFIPCKDQKQFARFLLHAAQMLVVGSSAVTLLFIGIFILTLAASTFLGGIDFGILPIAAALLYGIVLPLFLCGAFVPKENYPPSPKPVRIFVSIGLVPILAALGTVFYLYLFKILATNIWPSNEVSPYVIFGSCVGLMFLIFFSGAQEGDRAAKYFFGCFPLFWLLPLLMLFICAGMRIHAHGLTPMRALLVLFGIWTGVSLALAWFQKARFHVKTLPFIAAILLMAALLMPIGNIFSLSRHAQLARLDRALAQANMGDHTCITPNEYAADDQKCIILSACDYLLDEPNVLLTTEAGTLLRRDEYMQALGFSNIPQQENTDYGFLSSQHELLDTSNTQFLISDVYVYEECPTLIGTIPGMGEFSIDQTFSILVQNDECTYTYPLRKHLLAAITQGESGVDDWYVFDIPDAPIRVVIRQINYTTRSDSGIRVCDAEFDLLIRTH